MARILVVEDVESPWQQYQEIPDHILSMDEAVEIGAMYVWELFGESLDGMYIEMLYSDWGTARTYWQGTVYRDEEAAEQHELEYAAPLYNFLIDSVTGMRVDITATIDTKTPSTEELEVLRNRRHDTWELMQSWYEKDITEQIAEIGLTETEIDAYKKQATELAEKHFNNSTVAEAGLISPRPGANLHVRPRFDEADNMKFFLESLTFSVTDDTGREALITIPSKNAHFASAIIISTQHNDFIPDLNGRE